MEVGIYIWQINEILTYFNSNAVFTLPDFILTVWNLINYIFLHKIK